MTPPGGARLHLGSDAITWEQFEQFLPALLNALPDIALARLSISKRIAAMHGAANHHCSPSWEPRRTAICLIAVTDQWTRLGCRRAIRHQRARWRQAARG